MGDARTSGGQPPGSRSLAFKEVEEKGKKSKGLACGSGTAAASVPHGARAPLTAQPTSERLWAAGFGDSGVESLVPRAA